MVSDVKTERTVVPLKLGDTVYVSIGYQGKIDQRVVTGETRDSWIIGENWAAEKIPKRLEPSERLRTRSRREGRSGGERVYLSQQEVDDAQWVNKYRHSIGSQVTNLSDVETLRKIAELIGHKEKV